MDEMKDAFHIRQKQAIDYPRTYLPTCVSTYIHTRKHTYIYTYKHIYTRTSVVRMGYTMLCCAGVLMLQTHMVAHTPGH